MRNSFLLRNSGMMFFAGCAAALSLSMASPASADLTVTSEVRTVYPADPANPSGVTRPEETRNTTVYYRGERARVERGDGTVTLYDMRVGRVYLLTTSDRSYKTWPLTDFLKNDPFVVAPVVGRNSEKIDVKVDLTKDSVVDSKTLAGFPARVYNLDGTAMITPEAPASSGGGGILGGGRRGRGGGGFPGRGGDSSSEDRGGRTPVRAAKYQGEVWLSEPEILKSTTRYSWVPLLQSGVPSARLLQPLADRIARSRAFPLSTKVIVDVRNSSSSGTTSVTLVSTVKSISEAEVDEGLFKIPSDYTRADTK